MKEIFYVKKIAVLGAGVMGAQIAAQCINAGIETLLYDLPAKEGDPNQLIRQSIEHLKKLKPSPLGDANTANLIQARNYDSHLAELGGCDFIIEAIGERMEWKEALYKRIAPVLTDKSILVTNTSGLSINALANALPKAQSDRFCGVHFFNPPRYMHLAELIPAHTTSPLLLDQLESWLTSFLGKGVVRAKDTPNFIANRIGVFSLLVILHHTMEAGLGLDEVDQLTGLLIGRPKSATFRTMDVVGLDTLQHVIHTMQSELVDDPWRSYFVLPEWLSAMIEAGHLGQKSGQGIYRKKGQDIEVFDPETGSYSLGKGKVDEAVKQIMALPEAERFIALFQSSNRQAQFLATCFRDLFHYCAVHLEDIAHCVRDVDLALRWGFGWKQGPFETWQNAGFAAMRTALSEAIDKKQLLSTAPLPAWLFNIDAFYTAEGAFAPSASKYEPRRDLPVYHRQFFPQSMKGESIFRPTKSIFRPTIWYENEGVTLWHLKDDVAVISFRSKSNTINQAVLDGMHQALDHAEQRAKGLIIYQHNADNFCLGADLAAIAKHLAAKKYNEIERMIQSFQTLVTRLKYSALPVVAALRGRAFGGGAELLLHCTAIVAAFESYVGLVEVGVGLIPAGGGCKEMALRASREAKSQDMLASLKPYYERIGTAAVSGSAMEALQFGYLRPQDTWVMHQDEVLFAALSKVKTLLDSNYLPPIPQSIAVAGRTTHAVFQAGLVNWLEGQYISQHDYFLLDQMAAVLCGGDLDEGTQVDENWFLQREREVFMSLVTMSITEQRILHMLTTGKPLRN